MNWISQTSLTIAKSIKTEWFTEAWEGERCLWNVNFVIYKNRYKKANSRKRLAEHLSVTGTVRTVMSSWTSPKISKTSCRVMRMTFLYSDLSSNLCSCTSFSYKTILILPLRKGFPHTGIFLFFLFFNK